jgi:hypothetical protein
LKEIEEQKSRGLDYTEFFPFHTKKFISGGINAAYQNWEKAFSNNSLVEELKFGVKIPIEDLSKMKSDGRNHFIKDQRWFGEELQRYQEFNAIEDFNQDKKLYMSRFFSW